MKCQFDKHEQKPIMLSRLKREIKIYLIKNIADDEKNTMAKIRELIIDRTPMSAATYKHYFGRSQYKVTTPPDDTIKLICEKVLEVDPSYILDDSQQALRTSYLCELINNANYLPFIDFKIQEGLPTKLYSEIELRDKINEKLCTVTILLD